jgi:hypothetical protein
MHSLKWKCLQLYECIFGSLEMKLFRLFVETSSDELENDTKMDIDSVCVCVCVLCVCVCMYEQM